jgi:hypothetical protein
MKYLTLILAIVGACLQVNAQAYLNKKNIQFGTSATYIADQNEKNINGNSFQELTLALNIATSVHPKVQIGINYLHIYHTDNVSSKFNQSSIIGIFGQYSVWSRQNANIFVETSFNHGNYCTCDPNLPYTKNQLNYLGFGAGYNRRLRKNLFLDLAFNNYNILNSFKEKYNYTQYIIGLNYILNFKQTVQSF